MLDSLLDNGADSVALLQQAAQGVIAGDLIAAAQMISTIDREALAAERTAAYGRIRESVRAASSEAPKTRSQQGRNPGSTVRGTVFRRDQYTRRYVHCQRRTVDDDVLRLLSKLLPKVLPYDPHWKNAHPPY